MNTVSKTHFALIVLGAFLFLEAIFFPAGQVDVVLVALAGAIILGIGIKEAFSDRRNS